MKTFLFLDDIKEPEEARESFSQSNLLRFIEADGIDLKEYEIVVARDQYEFAAFLRDRGIPDLISFDYYLNYKIWDNNITGEVCAMWLYRECSKRKVDYPKHYCHTSDKTKAQEIHKAIELYKEHLEIDND
jgi:hypothetical protein